MPLETRADLRAQLRARSARAFCRSAQSSSRITRPSCGRKVKILNTSTASPDQAGWETRSRTAILSPCSTHSTASKIRPPIRWRSRRSTTSERSRQVGVRPSHPLRGTATHVASGASSAAKGAVSPLPRAAYAASIRRLRSAIPRGTVAPAPARSSRSGFQDLSWSLARGGRAPWTVARRRRSGWMASIGVAAGTWRPRIPDWSRGPELTELAS